MKKLGVFTAIACLWTGVVMAIPLPPSMVTDSLDSLVMEALAANPSLRAARSAYGAARENVRQAGVLDDPTVEAGFMPQPMSLPEGRQVGEVRVMQMFPWPGVRRAARNEAARMADAAEQRLRGEADELILSVHRQWWQLWQLRREADIRRMDREQLGGITTLATARLPTAGDPAAVLRLGYEAEAADTLLTSLDERIKAETVRFNLLLGRPAEQPLLLPDSLPLPELPPAGADLMAAILAGNPALAAWENEAAAWQARAEMERREGYPSAGLGLEYRIVAPSSSPTVMGGMNGRDMIMPMVSLRLPLWRGKYRARERQSRLRGEEALWRRQSEADALTAEAAALCADFRSMLRQAGLAGRQRRMIEASLTLRMAAFRTGEAGLTDILDLRRELLDSSLREVEAVVAAHIAVAEIEKLISKKDILD